MMTRYLWTIVVAGAVLTACGAAGEESHGRQETAASSAISQDAVFAPGGGSPVGDLTTLDADRSQACGITTRAMRLYARPWLDEKAWLADLQPYMSEQAWSDLQGTDPSRIPATAVTGDGVLAADEETNSDRLVTCQVPTDRGEYRVLLSRSPERPDWRVERIRSLEKRPS